MANETQITEVEVAQYDDEVAVLKAAGALDFPEVMTLRTMLDKVAGSGHTFVILDMAGVDLVCSAALGELMRCRNKLVERGGDLVLVGLQKTVRSKLTILGANRIFSFYQDVRAAMNAFKWDYKKHGKTVSVTIPSTLKLVPTVRQLASRLARQNGYSVKDAFRIETIVDEVCNNAVDHGSGGEITVKIVIDKEKVDITVTNQSDSAKVAVLEELVGVASTKTHVGSNEKRGRGLALIKMLSTKMDVNITEHGTDVHVIKLREE